MGYDIAAETHRVLTEGLPPLPTRLAQGETVAAARWCGERYGAVLFVRIWRNGQPDCDCSITERLPDGQWAESSFAGGHAWIDDPMTRPAVGWDGDPVVWCGSVGVGSSDQDEGEDEDADDVFDAPVWQWTDMRALLGAASARVAAIEVEHAGRTWTEPIESPCGAFVIGIESRGPATLRALDRDGSPLAYADGKTEWVS